MTKDERRAYERARYARLRETELVRIKANRDRDRKRNTDFLKEYKESMPCMDCDTFYPHYVMDFDHQRDKIDNVSNMAGQAVSIKKLMAEISKCDLVCANCHRKRTWGPRDEAE